MELMLSVIDCTHSFLESARIAQHSTQKIRPKTTGPTQDNIAALRMSQRIAANFGRIADWLRTNDPIGL
jgi:hypothetical protein